MIPNIDKAYLLKIWAWALSTGAAFIVGGCWLLAFSWPLDGALGVTLAIIGRVSIGVGAAMIIDMLRDRETPPDPTFVGFVTLAACLVTPG